MLAKPNKIILHYATPYCLTCIASEKCSKIIYLVRNILFSCLRKAMNVCKTLLLLCTYLHCLFEVQVFLMILIIMIFYSVLISATYRLIGKRDRCVVCPFFIEFRVPVIYFTQSCVANAHTSILVEGVILSVLIPLLYFRTFYDIVSYGDVGL